MQSREWDELKNKLDGLQKHSFLTYLKSVEDPSHNPIAIIKTEEGKEKEVSFLEFLHEARDFLTKLGELVSPASMFEKSLQEQADELVQEFHDTIDFLLEEVGDALASCYSEITFAGVKIRPRPLNKGVLLADLTKGVDRLIKLARTYIELRRKNEILMLTAFEHQEEMVRSRPRVRSE